MGAFFFFFFVHVHRGKDAGHDVDLLLTHPDEGGEVGLLSKLLEHLNEQVGPLGSCS